MIFKQENIKRHISFMKIRAEVYRRREAVIFRRCGLDFPGKGGILSLISELDHCGEQFKYFGTYQEII